MTPDQIEQMADGVFVAVKGYVDRTVAVQAARIAVLEQRIAELEARPKLRYLGVHDPEKQYGRGDFVTCGGSVWAAKCQTRSRPGSDDGSWQLAVKHGSPGKDARP